LGSKALLKAIWFLQHRPLPVALAVLPVAVAVKAKRIIHCKMKNEKCKIRRIRNYKL